MDRNDWSTMQHLPGEFLETYGGVSQPGPLHQHVIGCGLNTPRGYQHHSIIEKIVGCWRGTQKLTDTEGLAQNEFCIYVVLDTVPVDVPLPIEFKTIPVLYEVRPRQ